MTARRRTHSDRRDYEVGLRRERAHQLPSYNKRRKKCGKNLLSLRQVYTAASSRVQQRAGFCSALSIAIYSRSFCSCILSPSASASHLSSFPVELLFSSSSSSPPPLITVGVARQQPAHRGQANFLPAVILFRPSRPLSLCPARRRAGTTRPLRAQQPSSLFSLSYPLTPLSITVPRHSGSSPFLPRPEGGASSAGSSHGCPSRFFYRASHNVSYCVIIFPGYRSPPNPFLPTCPALMRRALSISVRR